MKRSAWVVSSLANFRFLAVVVLSTIAFSSIQLKATGQDQVKTISPKEFDLALLRSMSENIQQVATILRDNDIEVDAPSLFTISGRKKVRPQLNAIPEMSLSKVHTGSLGGLILAHELVLPVERVPRLRVVAELEREVMDRLLIQQPRVNMVLGENPESPESLDLSTGRSVMRSPGETPGRLEYQAGRCK